MTRASRVVSMFRGIQLFKETVAVLLAWFPRLAETDRLREYGHRVCVVIKYSSTLDK